MKAGDLVTIFNNRYPSGYPIIEGRAKLIKRSRRGPGVWNVAFDGSYPGETYERLVIEEAQTDPDAYLAQVREEMGFSAAKEATNT